MISITENNSLPEYDNLMNGGPERPDIVYPPSSEQQARFSAITISEETIPPPNEITFDWLVNATHQRFSATRFINRQPEGTTPQIEPHLVTIAADYFVKKSGIPPVRLAFTLTQQTRFSFDQLDLADEEYEEEVQSLSAEELCLLISQQIIAYEVYKRFPQDEQEEYERIVEYDPSPRERRSPKTHSIDKE